MMVLTSQNRGKISYGPHARRKEVALMAKCRKGLCRAALVLLITLTLAVCANAAPTSLTAIPLVPGSRPDPEEAALWEERSALGGGMGLYVQGTELPLLTEDHAFYTVDAPLEDVVRYYLRELAAIEEYDAGYDLERLDYGEVSPVYMYYYFYDWQFEDSYDFDGNLIRSGEMIREMLSKHRKAWSADGWLSSVEISWTYKDYNGNFHLFTVDCTDQSFDELYTEFTGTKTLISMHHRTFMSVEDAWDLESAAINAEYAEMARKMVLAPPTNESIGIPFYPNAEFQPEISAGMSLSGTAMYVFLTTDTPAEVIKWYEQRTGKKAQSWEPDHYLLVISGQVPFPEKGLSVQPNLLFPGNWKTIITLIAGDGSDDDGDD